MNMEEPKTPAIIFFYFLFWRAARVLIRGIRNKRTYKMGSLLFFMGIDEGSFFCVVPFRFFFLAFLLPTGVFVISPFFFLPTFFFCFRVRCRSSFVYRSLDFRALFFYFLSLLLFLLWSFLRNSFHCILRRGLSSRLSSWA